MKSHEITIPYPFEPDFVTGRKAKDFILERLTDNQINVFKSLQNNPTSTQIEVAEKLNISIAGVKKIILRLQELELLSREGSKKLAIGSSKYTVIVDYKVDFLGVPQTPGAGRRGIFSWNTRSNSILSASIDASDRGMRELQDVCVIEGIAPLNYKNLMQLSGKLF